MIIRVAGVSCGIVHWIGLAVILSGTELVAQEGEGNVVPAGTQSAEPTATASVKNPAATNVTPTSVSGRPMQAFGKKKKGRRSSDASSEFLDVLPPMPSASAAEKRKWLARQKAAEKKKWRTRQKAARADKPRVQPVKPAKVASPSKRATKSTSAAPAPSPAATPTPTNVTPTSLTGQPMQAFGKKKKKGRRSEASSGDLYVLPPIPAELKPKKKKGWLF